MEAIDTQRRFEQLISELERLEEATNLIEENASQTRELSERAKEVVDALHEFVPAVKESTKESFRLLKQKAGQLDALKEDFDAFLERAGSEHQDRLAALSETLDEAVERQAKRLNQYNEKQGQLRQRMNTEFERGERAVLALLVLQGLTVALVFLLYLTG